MRMKGLFCLFLLILSSLVFANEPPKDCGHFSQNDGRWDFLSEHTKKEKLKTEAHKHRVNQWIGAQPVIQRTPLQIVLSPSTFKISVLYVSVPEAIDLAEIKRKAPDFYELETYFLEDIKVLVLLSRAGSYHYLLEELAPKGSLILGGTRYERELWGNSTTFSFLPGTKIQELFFPIQIGVPPR